MEDTTVVRFTSKVNGILKDSNIGDISTWDNLKTNDLSVEPLNVLTEKIKDKAGKPFQASDYKFIRKGVINA